MHPYFLYTIYKDRLSELERRAELHRIFMDGVATERTPGVTSRAVRAARAKLSPRLALRAHPTPCR